MSWLLLLMALVSTISSVFGTVDFKRRNRTDIHVLGPESQGNTILLFGENSGLILSQNRSKWIKLALKPPYNPYGSGAVYLNDEIYLFGGKYKQNALYKLDKNLKWIRLANMNGGRDQITNSCLEWNGYIWVFGGWDGRYKALKSVERYDLKEDKWTRMPDMKSPRVDAAVVLWNNRIIISGGWANGLRTNSAECYNPETGNCPGQFRLPTQLDDHSLIFYKEKLITIGGTNRESLQINKTWEFDPLSSSWKSLPPMKYSSSSFGGIILDEEIYAIGGIQNNSCLTRVEIFDGEMWRDGPILPSKWCSMPAVIIPQKLADILANYTSF